MRHLLSCLLCAGLGCEPVSRPEATAEPGPDTLVVALGQAPARDPQETPSTEADLILAGLVGPIPADPCAPAEPEAPHTTGAPGAWELVAWNGGTEIVLEPRSPGSALGRVVLRVIPRFTDRLVELDATGVDLLLDVRQDKAPEFARARSGEMIGWLPRHFLGALELGELEPRLARAVAACVSRGSLITEAFTGADGVRRAIPALTGSTTEACGDPPQEQASTCQAPTGAALLLLADPEPPMLAAAAEALARQLQAGGFEVELVLETSPARRSALRLSEWPAGALPSPDQLLPLYWRDALVVVDDRFAEPALPPHAPLSQVQGWQPAPGTQRYRR